MSTRQRSAGTAQFPNMLKVANEIGCQIQPSTGNPSILTGLCPFHESQTLHEAKTLHVDLHTTRFWCAACEHAGNPMAFIAKVWGMSAQETYEFISSGCEVTAERPRRERNGRWNEDDPPEAQNTAVLTLATRYYGQRVKLSFTALSYLAKLGIEPAKAVGAGFGYCTGEGLREYLKQRGCTQEEIEESPLFQEVTGMEILSGCLVLSDLDYTGATIWMMGLPPDESNTGAGWRNGRPRSRGIKGRRNQLFNLKAVQRNTKSIVVTDDPRLHLVLEAENVPSVMNTHSRRNTNINTTAGRIGEVLAKRSPAALIMAMHDHEMGEKIHQATTRNRPETKRERRSIREIIQQLNPQERDLANFARHEQDRPGGDRTGGTSPRGTGPGREKPREERKLKEEQTTRAEDPGKDTREEAPAEVGLTTGAAAGTNADARARRPVADEPGEDPQPDTGTGGSLEATTVTGPYGNEEVPQGPRQLGDSGTGGT